MSLFPGLQIIQDGLQMNLGIIFTIIINAGIIASFISIDFKLGALIGLIGNGLVFIMCWFFFDKFGTNYAAALLMMIVWLIVLVFSLLSLSERRDTAGFV